MTPERWLQVKELLHSALERSEGTRAQFLDEACRSDSALRAEVETLLAASNEAGDFLMQPAMEQDPIAGTRLGPYRLQEVIGRGGMGTVFRAVRDDEQFQQEVAIKLVKRGMDTDAVLARFRYERQILAFLSHPYIGHILDGGAAPDGRPYIVMELINGLPIIEYCERMQLGVEDRLRLFRKVCSAVEYAHRNLIVHRDLKPGNILITPEGEPKLLDFGIAKILLPALPELSRGQTIAMRLLTPDYASPEQVRGEQVNTSTDVYSLGTILYELLTGRRAQRLESLTPSDIERVVCTQDPPRPSEANPALARRLRGDLDNIVMKALQKEPSRRYQSVEQFSEDVRRYLEGLPVWAREDTLFYRASKFVRRHRVGVGSTVLLALALAGGAVATAWQARQARIERDRATRWFEGGRRLANSFLIEHDALASIPGGTGLREKLMSDALRYLNALSREAGTDPQLQRELALAYERMGEVQGRADGPNLGDTAAAINSFRESIRLLEHLVESQGERRDRLELSAAYVRLSGALKVTGDYTTALDLDRKALAIREALHLEDPRDLQLRRLLASSYTHLGATYFHIADWTGVLESRRKALALAREIVADGPAVGEDYRALALAELRMGSMLVRNQDVEGGLRHYEASLKATDEGMRAFPTHTPIRLTKATTLNAIGRQHLVAGRFETALAHYREALRIYQGLLAADQKDIRTASMLAGSYLRTGQAYLHHGDPGRALPELRRALEMREDLAARDPANSGARGEVAESYASLGDVMSAAGQHARAADWYRRALKILEDLDQKKQTNPESLAELQRVRERIAALGLPSR